MSLPTQTQVHLVSKQDPKTHHVVTLSPPPPSPLPPSSLRLRTTLLSLTSTNLSYALRGHIFNWWDAYPVTLPSLRDLPAPSYNDPAEYGVIPSWGFATILESTVPGLEKGKSLYGFVPTMSAEIVLSVVPGELEGQWREVSQRREKLLNINNFYEVVEGEVDGEERARGLEAVFRCLWLGGHVVNGFVFGGEGLGVFHPLGRMGGEGNAWGKEEGDLRGAVVVCLSAGGKTARAFSDCLLFERREMAGPLGYVAVTSKRETKVFVEGAKIATKTMEYGDIGGKEMGEWIAALKPEKVVVCDFGGRKGSYDALLDSLKGAVPNARVLTVCVGSEPEILSPEENLAMGKARAAYRDWYQMNTSLLKDAIVRQVGMAKFKESSARAWNGFLRRGNLDGISLDLDHGVDGIYRGWEKLVKGGLKADTAMAFAM